eukprot:SAG31_NODE_3162_length_4606_cov_22.721544_5_plen_252_part_00
MADSTVEFTADELSQWTDKYSLVEKPKGRPSPEAKALLDEKKAFLDTVIKRTGISKKQIETKLSEAAASTTEAETATAHLQPPSGTRDFFPEEMRERNWLFGHFRETARLCGFQEYDAPVLENTYLYERKAGEEITQQMYNFTDKEGAEVTLRPEMTPSLARMILLRTRIATGEVKEQLPIKWFSIPQCWRFETCQRGRKREHYQWNMDIAGVTSITGQCRPLPVENMPMPSVHKEQCRPTAAMRNLMRQH